MLPGDDVVGTTTSLFVCAEAMELARNMDNPKPLQRINFRVGDDINHPLVKIKNWELLDVMTQKFYF